MIAISRVQTKTAMIVGRVYTFILHYTEGDIKVRAKVEVIHKNTYDLEIINVINNEKTIAELRHKSISRC